MIKSRTQSERSVVVVDVVLVVAGADGDDSGHGHGHVYGHDLLRLSRDWNVPLPSQRPSQIHA
jgi:hypothetical protein